MLESEGKQFNVIDFIKDYVDIMDYDEETKSKVEKKITLLFESIKED